MKKIILLNIILSFFYSQALLAKACGSGPVQYIVPDASLFGVPFYKACKNHDVCYDECGKERKKCDQNLRSDIKDLCRDHYKSNFFLIQRNMCLSTANRYYDAVRKHGGEAYRKAQNNCQHSSNTASNTPSRSANNLSTAIIVNYLLL